MRQGECLSLFLVDFKNKGTEVIGTGLPSATLGINSSTSLSPNRQAHHNAFALAGKKKADTFVSTSLLSHQGSNLDSSVPKTDVLPVTPWDNICYNSF